MNRTFTLVGGWFFVLAWLLQWYMEPVSSDPKVAPIYAETMGVILLGILSLLFGVMVGTISQETWARALVFSILITLAVVIAVVGLYAIVDPSACGPDGC